MKRALCLLVFGFCISYALEGFTPIFSTIDDSTKTLSSIAVDDNSAVAVMGSFNNGEFHIGKKNYTAENQDVFIAKLHANHSVLWSYQIGGSSPDDPSVLTFDIRNNIIFGGKFASHSIKFQNTVLNKTNTDTENFYFDIMLGKIRSNGSLWWMLNFGDSNESASQHLSDIAITTDNNIVVCGVFHAVGYFGANRFHATSHPKARFPLSNLFVAKYTTHGDHMWSIGLGGNKEDAANSLALDKEDAAFVAGTYHSSDFELNGALLPEPQGRDCLLIKYRIDGRYEWHKQFGSRGTDNLKSIAIDEQENIILAGEVGGNVTIDDHLIPAEGYHNLLLLKLSKRGNYLWGQTFAAEFVTPKKVLFNFRTGFIVMFGNYNSERFVIGQNSLPASSSDCLFIAEWTKDGQIVSSQGLCGQKTIHTESGAIDRKSGRILIGCDLYDLSVLGRKDTDSQQSGIAILQQDLATQAHAAKKDEL